MDNQAEVSDFLRSRRARLTPDQAGIIGGARRRVAGLRREEVAMLAGMSSDYYAKMERGNLAGVSTEVLNALAAALHLDDAETDHLHDLARAAGPAAIRRPARPKTASVRPSLQRFLDTNTGTPTVIQNRRADLVAFNSLGRALLAPMLNDPTNQANNARFTFLSPASRNFYPDWENGADSLVASMRSAAGKNPHDKDLTDLIGELVTRSDAFRQRWAAHDVRFHRSGKKRIHHPDVGDLEFEFEGMELPGTPGWMLYAYTTQPGSPTEERVQLLGSLAATQTESVAGTARES
ncbi:XRE family transcriptional regulator [Mycetocola manganoxydans]|uniref:XRE family transcriptional regulator n=1 Tax=Mycetocola manganoxydans TaxID=699879 RepID=A0A3L6ZKG9_9MICO|nr:helix-turn-helix transcriptional regulator [Mycetocola manganoxydans]RLP68165.1 XRE family transcriptional regulator [Mycetocola manganoxydans]GHD52537.1 transcriptional regulator [Mycetocola manganoxydans]